MGKLPEHRSAAALQYRKLYFTKRWQRVVKRQLATHPLCAMCEDAGRIVAATVCDHVRPHRGDKVLFWSGPFQSLCSQHHNRDKAMIERGTPLVDVDKDGWPLR